MWCCTRSALSIHSNFRSMLKCLTASQPHSHKFVKKLSLGSLFVAALVSANIVQAHEKGDFIVRVGLAGTHITTDLFDGEIALGVRRVVTGVRNLDIETKNDTRPVLNFTYMFSNVVGLDVIASTAYKHDVRMSFEVDDRASGTSEAVDLNTFEFKQQPIALGVTFYPRGAGAAGFHPYLGVGAIYTRASLKLHDDAVEFMRNKREKEIKNNPRSASEEWARQQRENLDLTIDQMREDLADSVRKDNWGAYATLGADFKLTDKLLLNTQIRYNYSASDFTYLNYVVGLGYKF